MLLREIAFARAGDKGDVVNVCVFPYRSKDWSTLRGLLTVDKVRDALGILVTGHVVRFEMPGTEGLNFVAYAALDGGPSMSLRADPHGKSFEDIVLDIELALAEYRVPLGGDGEG